MIESCQPLKKIFGSAIFFSNAEFFSGGWEQGEGGANGKKNTAQVFSHAVTVLSWISGGDTSSSQSVVTFRMCASEIRFLMLGSRIPLS